MGRGYYGGRVGAEFPGELGAEFEGELGEGEGMMQHGLLERRDPRIEDLSLGSPAEGWTIPAGQTVQFELNPRLVYRGHRLIFTPGSADTPNGLTPFFGCALESVNINARDQIVTRDAVPLCVYGPNATHVLGGDVMRPGVGALMRITNFSATDATVHATLVGEAVRPDAMPVEAAIQLLRASPRYDLAPRVRSPYEDLVGAGPLFTLTVPANTVGGPEIVEQLNPKLRFRASRVIWVGRTVANNGDDLGAGAWLPSGFAGVVPGVGVMSQMEIATIDQVIAGTMDMAAMTTDATWRIKGTIMDPGNGAYISARAIYDNSTGENPVTLRVQPVVFGRADTAG